MAATTVVSYPPTAGVQFAGPNQPVVAGTPVIVQPSASSRTSLDRNQLTTMKALSIIQIVSGVLSILFNAVLMFNTIYHLVGAGIWCGVFFIITGILGIVGAVQNNRCLFVATLVMSIVSSLSLSAIIGFIGLAFDKCLWDRFHYSLACSRELFAFGLSLVCVFGIELFVSIWTSVLCCTGVRKISSPQGMHYAAQPVYYAVQPSVGGQPMTMPPSNFTVSQPPRLTPDGRLDLSQATYPRQLYAVTASDGTGASYPINPT